MIIKIPDLLHLLQQLPTTLTRIDFVYCHKFAREFNSLEDLHLVHVKYISRNIVCYLYRYDNRYNILHLSLYNNTQHALCWHVNYEHSGSEQGCKTRVFLCITTV